MEIIRNEFAPRKARNEKNGEPETPPPAVTAGKTEPQTGPEPARTETQPEKSVEPVKLEAAKPESAPVKSAEPVRETSPGTEPGARRTPETAPPPASPEPAATAIPAELPRPRSEPSTVAAPPTARNQTARTPAEERERALYFIEVDRSGSILRTRVNRKLPVSESPMTDALRALISGPSADEEKKGLISLIPPATKILSTTVRGSTAYISFSEDFQYNTYGVEGYAGQLRQIVFTVTEFPNVNDVQILIEGRRLDYLGEGIWIGSPLNREML